ncbi:MAG: 4-hydroxy-tetrahydrodipicolinate reductase [Myxococcales bacterium]|nr:4-hydroxy-tetrahydrodipicolinate reductase [Myxococcales bacterium]
MLRIAVPGAAGKMGRTILRVLQDTDGVELVAAIERPGHPDLGKDAGLLAGLAANGVIITSSLDEALAKADLIIDFTVPAATAWTASRAAEAEVALVIGTTGLGEAERRAVERAAKSVPVVLSPNMAVGVNVLFGLLDAAARALGDAYDVEIVEAHHRQKKDSPSGTALRMAEVIAAALDRDLADVACYGRKGATGARPPREIGIMTVRGGDVIGDHSAHFLGLGERLEITHRASSRDTFAHGAVRAALWLGDRDPGLYDLQDVLGLRR